MNTELDIIEFDVNEYNLILIDSQSQLLYSSQLRIGSKNTDITFNVPQKIPISLPK